MKNKILIVGPIADFGGREVEVNTVLTFLMENYDVKLLSTIPITEKSTALYGLNCKWGTIFKELNNSNLLIRGLSLLSKKINKSNLPSYFLVDNKISRIFIDFNKESNKILNKEIKAVDAVLFFGVLTSGFLKETMNHCLESGKPFVLRTTGKIDSVPDAIKDFLPKLASILVHSESNTMALKEVTSDNVSIVDQTTLVEEELIGLPITETDNLNFGFLGRFSTEKGIVPLLANFENLNKKLVIAGSGPLLDEVKEKCANNPFLEYIGALSSDQLGVFFDKIDVLIIPSFEESGPLVGIEAMAAGKLLLSTKVGAMTDRLETTDNQFWFEIEDKDSFLNTISTIEKLNKYTLAEIRMQMRERYKNKYSKTVLARRYLDVFDTVI